MKNIYLENRLQELRQKSTRELTEEDIIFLKNSGIINGCGGKDACILQKFLLKIISPIFFEASCYLHDFWYWKWWDEKRRKECDEKFLEAILRDIEEWLLWRWRECFDYKERKFDKLRYLYFFLKSKKYKFLAKIFYIAVRIGGRKYFNYY